MGQREIKCISRDIGVVETSVKGCAFWFCAPSFEWVLPLLLRYIYKTSITNGYLISHPWAGENFSLKIDVDDQHCKCLQTICREISVKFSLHSFYVVFAYYFCSICIFHWKYKKNYAAITYYC